MTQSRKAILIWSAFISVALIAGIVTGIRGARLPSTATIPTQLVIGAVVTALSFLISLPVTLLVGVLSIPRSTLPLTWQLFPWTSGLHWWHCGARRFLAVGVANASACAASGGSLSHGPPSFWFRRPARGERHGWPPWGTAMAEPAFELLEGGLDHHRRGIA